MTLKKLLNPTRGRHHRRPSSPSSCQLEQSRHYYTSAQRFEQSVDVYRPVSIPEHDDSVSSNRNSNNTSLIVVLVVGSGWMGHCAWIYRLTSWWNASGPATVARALQAPCICVRHRGAFFQLPSWKWLFLYLLGPVLAAVWCCAVAAGTMVAYNKEEQEQEQQQQPHEAMFTNQQEKNNDQISSLVVSLMIAFIALLTLCAFFKWSARGSATLEDMVHDVATALEWVEQHKHTTQILLPLSANNSANNVNSNKTSTVRIVFGGYSSGGHVAMTLLSRPDIWQQHPSLRPAQEFLSGILLIAGVLAVEPVHEDALMLLSNHSRQSRNKNDEIGVTETTTSSFSGSDTDDTRSDSDSSLVSSSSSSDGKAIATAPAPSPPVWLTNFVMRTVWGPYWATTIPSPLLLLTENNNVQSHLPHLVIQNRFELFFGLRWLDIFFCAQPYCQVLRSLNKNNNSDKRVRGPVIFCEVDSDHWFILGSRQLHDAVQEYLPRLFLNDLPAAPSSSSSDKPTSKHPRNRMQRKGHMIV